MQTRSMQMRSMQTPKICLHFSLCRDIIISISYIEIVKGYGMELNWLTPLQVAEKWGITERQVQYLCLHGKIPGATKVSKVWLIPEDAQKPIDGRTKAAKANKDEVT